jgi:hypothetical protein
MSTAQEIIQDAADNIGRGSEITSTDSSILNRGLVDLRSIMEGLRKDNIILEETVNDVTTTIDLPDALGDELNEPVASRIHLVNMLAIHMATQSRVNLAERGVPIPTVTKSRNELARMYRQYNIPNKHPSRLMPRGQGSKSNRRESTFFNGEELSNDVT